MAKLGELIVPKHADWPDEGIALWENPHNGFTVLAVHYSATPEKRTSTWLADAQRGYSEREWAQEYELSFNSWAGRAVYPLFDRARHVAAGHLEYRPDYPMQRWWDIGKHACVWAQRIDRELRIYHSLQVAGAFGTREKRYLKWEVDVSGLSQFIEYCVGESDDFFPEARAWRDIIDPSGFNSDVNHIRSSANYFQDHNIRPIAGETTNMDLRIADVEDWMVMSPGLQIDPSVRVVIDGFSGGYILKKEGASEVPDNQSGYGHVQTCVQYGASKNRALHVRRNSKRERASRLDPAMHDTERYLGRKRGRGEHYLSY
jgi:hypothetical protein